MTVYADFVKDTAEHTPDARREKKRKKNIAGGGIMRYTACIFVEKENKMKDIHSILSQMTLEEKAGMCSGADFWRLKSVERLGVPQVMVSDGPHGLRKQDEKSDHLGVNESIKAVCFPAACASVCSFDRELLKTLGETLGDECQSEGVSVILGPAANIKRSPLCGRNFEYISEDPYLAGETAAALIQGVQSKNVGTSVKHFAANNQEYRRMTCSSEVDERTLREIYLPPFETAVKKGKPDTVMCSYNKVNGVFASENKTLLTDILRDEWGFDGYVVSDWGAVNNRVAGLEAGLDLEMPSSGGVTDKEIVEAVRSGRLQESTLDKAVERILAKIFKFTENRRAGNFDKKAHHAFAARVEEESAVLLKNNGVLPLAPGQGKIAVIGVFAEKPRFQGGGSSHINACEITSALQAFDDMAKTGAVNNLDYAYAPGFTADGGVSPESAESEKRAAEACALAAEACAAVVFAGLPDSYECESYDRKHMKLPEQQTKLIERIAAVQKNTVVVLHNGSPVEMPWIDSVAAVLELYLGGQAVGTAAANILLGSANPCGKLAETFPLRLEDTPAYLNFPGDGKKVFYNEGIFVGYRWYDARKMPVLFPFGHGLSYTSFEYKNIRLSAGKTTAKTLAEGRSVSVSVDVTNTGGMAGKEIVQIYVSDESGATQRPPKELKGFSKIPLEKGETKTVTVELDFRSFAYFDTNIHDWYIPSGTYKITAAKSSRDEGLSAFIEIENDTPLPLEIDENTTLGDLYANPAAAKVLGGVKEIAGIGAFETDDGGSAAEAITSEMQKEMMLNTPLRALRSFNNVGTEQLDDIIGKLKQAVAPRHE